MPIDYPNTCFLLVDDEPDSIEIVEMLLSSKGSKVVTASNGKEGLALFKTETPKFVLTDLSMPEMNGWDFLINLREVESTKTIVIAVTAHAMDGDKERVFSAGFDGYIAKPLNMFSLLDDIEKWLD